MHLDDSVVLVTGANRGIGAAVVRACLKTKAAKVYAAARNPEKLPDFGDARAVPLKLDIFDDAQVEAAAREAGDTRILINNAGVASFVNLLAADLGAIEYDMNVNYYGTLKMVRAFVPCIEANGGGTIVNVLSVLSLASMPAAGGYCASKAALHSLTQALRLELSGKGIDVIGVYPGPIDTDMAAGLDVEKTPPEAVAEAILEGIESGSEEIWPDPMAKHVGETWLRNPKELETMFANFG